MSGRGQEAAWNACLRQVGGELPRGRDAARAVDSAPASPESIAAAHGLILIEIRACNDVPAGVPVIRLSPAGSPEPERRRTGDETAQRRWAVAPVLDAAQRQALPGWLIRRWLEALAPSIVAFALAVGLALAAIHVALTGSEASVVLVAGGALAIGWAWQMAMRAGTALGDVVGWHLRTATLRGMLAQPGHGGSSFDQRIDPGVLGSVDVIVSTGIRQLTPVTALAIGSTLPCMVAAGLASAPVALLVLLAPALGTAGLRFAAPRIVHPAATALTHAARGFALLTARLDDPAQALRSDVEHEAQATIDGNARSRRAMLPLIAVGVLLPYALAIAGLPGSPPRVDATVAVIALFVTGALWGTLLHEAGRSLASLAPLAPLRALLDDQGSAVGMRSLAGEGPGLEPASVPGDSVTIHATNPEMAASYARRLVDGDFPRAFIPADRTLPSGSLGDIVAGPSCAPAEERDRIAARVGLDGFVRFLPLGWATPIFDQAPWIDPATRVRILLARALVKAPALLVVDRALDSLAEPDREALTASIATLPCTVVLVTTRSDLAMPGRERRTLDGTSHVEADADGGNWVAMVSTGPGRLTP